MHCSKMRIIASEGVAWSVSVSVSVRVSCCLWVTFVSSAKTAEPIETSSGGLIRVGSK